MTPEQLRLANIRHFERVLARTTDGQERARIEPASAYPAQAPRRP